MTEFLELPSLVATVFVVMMAWLFWRDLRTYKGSAHQNFKSAIVSLGILGTFVGIAIGLWGFDTNNIEKSVPILLGGLKTAFTTSIFGMFFSIVLSIIQRATSSTDSTDMTEQIKQQRAELRDSFNKNHETLIKIADSVGQFDGQISGLRTELKDQSGESRKLIQNEFAKANETLAESLQKISEGANQEIIDALNDSIRGFNQNLTEQFGENSKQLNEACLKLVEWQKSHKQDVEATHKQLGDSVAALTQTEAILAAVAERNQEVLKTYDSLRDTIAAYDNQTGALTAHLEKYGGLADKAEKMFADADSRFEKITNAMGGFAADLTGKINTQSEVIDETLENMKTAVSNATRNMGKKYEESIDSMTQTVDAQATALAKLAKQMGEQNEEIAGDLRESLAEMQKTINAQSQALHELAENIVESVDEMESVFVSITTTMGEKYADFLSGAKHIAGMTPRGERDSHE